MKTVRRRAGVAVLATALLALGLPVVSAPLAQAAQPVPNHNRMVPDVPRNNTPRISAGEIWDLEVVGNRVFIAGSFSSITNNTAGNTTTVNQAQLAAYNIDTGLVDTTFRPTFGGGGVSQVEAAPDGSTLYVAGSFTSVNGQARRKVAQLSLTNGAPQAFNANVSANIDSLEVSATRVYIGGRFLTVNGTSRPGLAAFVRSSGALDTTFNLPLAGGIGVNGAMTVQQLRLTPDETRLLVVHTARQVAGQNRYGVALIRTDQFPTAASRNTLDPWKTLLWEDNLQYVGGVQRIYSGDISPNGQYFVVGSGSGGDRPPINDTAVAYPIAVPAGQDGNVQPLWITRNFDSVYSVAITERAVYIGGHMQFSESTTAPDPWPGLDNVGYGTGQGLSGYGLGDSVVRRDHLVALNPTDGHALEWYPIANSFEGNKALKATPRGLFSGGDGMFQGGVRTGRVAFFDFNADNSVDSDANETVINNPIEGRVVQSGIQFVIDGTATASSGVRRVQVEVKNRDTGRFLQDDLTTWGSSNTIYASLANPNSPSTSWSLPVTVTGNQNLQVLARTVAVNGTRDATKANNKFESFQLDDLTPTTSITTPSGFRPVLNTLTVQFAGTATDDKGIESISYWFRDEQNRYLQDDGSVASEYNTFRGLPDVVGATQATWQYEVTFPHEGVWRAAATATDNSGQADLRSATKDVTITTTGAAPVVAINTPRAMTPPTTPPTFAVTPGQAITFSGTATDEAGLAYIEVSLRNTTTRENLGNDGSWGTNVIAGNYRVSVQNIPGATATWTYTLAADRVKPGSYTFGVRAVDDLGLSSSQGRLNFNGQYPGNAFPDTIMTQTGTNQDIEVLRLDLSGTATDDAGVSSVKVSLLDSKTGKYVRPNGTLEVGFGTVDAVLTSPGAASTPWTLSINLPQAGDYTATAYAFDAAGQSDISTTGATARFLVFPGDALPTLSDTLGQPTEGTAFNQSRIVVTGRALDDTGLARVDVAIRNSAGLYMQSNGTFPTTATTESWRPAFVNSPGSVGSNYSYTSPVIPSGAYLVKVRATDVNNQVQTPTRDVNVTVSAPAGNLSPVARFTNTCTQNVCSFDARTSTDENAPTLTYSWTFSRTLPTALTATATGPVPTYYFQSAGAWTVTLTARDEYGLVGTATATINITEPPGNVAPTAVLNPPACVLLVCNVSAVGTTDANVGDSIAYLWNFGDGTTSTASAATKTYLAAGTYTLTLTATDGWGRASTVTRQVTVSAT